MPVPRPDCVRGEGRQISIWPPSPVLRHDTIPASHRTRFPVNARGDMAAVLSSEAVPCLLQLCYDVDVFTGIGPVKSPAEEAEARPWCGRRLSTFANTATADRQHPCHGHACASPASPQPSGRTPRTVTSSPSSTAVSAAPSLGGEP